MYTRVMDISGHGVRVIDVRHGVRAVAHRNPLNRDLVFTDTRPDRHTDEILCVVYVADRHVMSPATAILFYASFTEHSYKRLEENGFLLFPQDLSEWFIRIFYFGCLSFSKLATSVY